VALTERPPVTVVVESLLTVLVPRETVDVLTAGATTAAGCCCSGAAEAGGTGVAGALCESRGGARPQRSQ
jgi:hypothetical protein